MTHLPFAQVIDAAHEYSALMKVQHSCVEFCAAHPTRPSLVAQSIFNFDKLRALVGRKDFSLVYDAMHGGEIVWSLALVSSS